VSGPARWDGHPRRIGARRRRPPPDDRYPGTPAPDDRPLTVAGALVDVARALPGAALAWLRGRRWRR
jgi:hypothetical protein